MSASAGGQLEQPSDVNSSATTMLGGCEAGFGAGGVTDFAGPRTKRADALMSMLMARRPRNIPYAPASALRTGPASAAAISRVSVSLADETTNAANRPARNDDTRTPSP